MNWRYPQLNVEKNTSHLAFKFAMATHCDLVTNQMTWSRYCPTPKDEAKQRKSNTNLEKDLESLNELGHDIC